MVHIEVLRYSAFTTTPDGGNPAGVVLDALGLSATRMLAVAAEVGFSETAFLSPREDGELDVRYFSPLAEVSFCGHATIASAVAVAERSGAGLLRYRTQAGVVDVRTAPADGGWSATLTSVAPRSVELDDADLALLLRALRWSASDLDPALSPRAAYAGAWHPILAVRTRERLAKLDYDLPMLAAQMADRNWTTVDLLWRQDAHTFHARNPFPPGGVVEDPATGAAAAALGGYLREGGHVELPATVTVLQGDDMGRPSVLGVGIAAEPGSGIDVTGRAVRLRAMLAR